ncbi:hypothetical protein PR003_g26736 [Phytophthora rubi]|uniref:Secreted protein n=1 Tax=Phytophthora rubi TaxID=129364 RepID=A0A6A3HWW5_9STRA|nr:hypothetical protein PR002_g25984 [Phytophthora rubi]KAE8976160.1 hypothetical protein PR001_g25497 [Phytophthora rubi]KAE9284904.1 hypothetical protein PR003_g26736 [Phytophthora rubi]
MRRRRTLWSTMYIRTLPLLRWYALDCRSTQSTHTAGLQPVCCICIGNSAVYARVQESRYMGMGGIGRCYIGSGS